ncbi:MAG: hypothetical protein NT067_00175 [Candidatus Diapherotrites archaeon]|nr:hypothetical protein [Candidatus Diapherotrites archaeon]
MDKKGQIIAVDFLFSLVLLALALGYTFRIAEANDYALREEELYMDLQRIGTASSDLLVSSPDFTCEINMGGTQYFPNCINESKFSGGCSSCQASLGIPTDYDFNITIKITGSPATPLVIKVPTTPPENIYSEKRAVLSSPANPASIQAISGLAQKEITLNVWKK